jgi:hypothetical protein
MLKISLPGKDVNKASPEELAVDSDYDSWKLIVTNTNPYYGEILITFKTNPVAGTYNVLTYTYPFDYVPLYYFYFDIAKSSAAVSTNTGFDTATAFGLDVAFFQQFKVTSTTRGFKFDFINNGFGSPVAGTSYSFRYFVYVNDGT